APMSPPRPHVPIPARPCILELIHVSIRNAFQFPRDPPLPHSPAQVVRRRLVPPSRNGELAPMGTRGDIPVQAIAGFCLLLFILTVTVVGGKMLLLARRTRGRH